MKVHLKHGKVTQNMHGASRNYRYVWDVSVIGFPRGELKWTRRKLKLLKGCPIRGTSKVFVVFSVMLVSIEDLSRNFLIPRDPSLIFSRRMFLLYLMKIVKNPSKFLRKP